MYETERTYQRELEYKICERTGKYKDIDLKDAVCYSYGLVATKERTIGKNIVKEFEAIEKTIKLYNKRDFACLLDAEKEIEKLILKEFKKLKYHNVNLSVVSEEKKRRGRPSKEEQTKHIEYKYSLNIDASKDEQKVERELTSSCIFVLCSNDLSITAEEILKEYKTQDSVEKKFQQLKSPHFVNALYLKTPERIEAMAYMILISIMVLSVAEYVVRRGLKKDNDKIIGPGKIKMSHPTLMAIFSIFINVRVRVVQVGNKTQREFVRPLNDSILKVLKYLSIPESIFIQGFKSKSSF